MRIELIDFDFCGYGWQAYDIAAFLTEVTYWNMGEAVRREFLEGYQEVRKLGRGEILAVPLFEAARNIFSLGIPALNVNTWGSAYQNDRMIDIHIQNIMGAGDQAPNAQQCHVLGAGIVVDGAPLKAEAIRPAVKSILEQPSYRARARELQREIQALPSLSEAVKRLELLSRKHEPQLR